jgi:hypothetical protein
MPLGESIDYFDETGADSTRQCLPHYQHASLPPSRLQAGISERRKNPQQRGAVID